MEFWPNEEQSVLLEQFHSYHLCVCVCAPVSTHSQCVHCAFTAKWKWMEMFILCHSKFATRSDLWDGSVCMLVLLLLVFFYKFNLYLVMMWFCTISRCGWKNRTLVCLPSVWYVFMYGINQWKIVTVVHGCKKNTRNSFFAPFYKDAIYPCNIVIANKQQQPQQQQKQQ